MHNLALHVGKESNGRSMLAVKLLTSVVGGCIRGDAEVRSKAGPITWQSTCADPAVSTELHSFNQTHLPLCVHNLSAAFPLYGMQVLDVHVNFACRC